MKNKKWFTVCMCFNKDKCEAVTLAIAIKNNAYDHVVEPVGAPYASIPGYRGRILCDEN